MWWSWTPAASSWVNIQTGGPAETDTVLEVFRGAALNALDLRSFNDDGNSDISPASEVELFAEAGVTYQIQVGGYEGEEGPFTLAIAAAPERPLVTAITTSPQQVDVTNAPAAVQVDISVSYLPGLDSGRIVAGAPGTSFSVAAVFGAANRISGTAAAGTYRVTLDLPRLIPPGDYHYVLEFTGSDAMDVNFGTDVEYDGPGSEFAFPAGVASTFEVVNTGAASAYGAWLARYPSLQGADALRNADPDSDGFTNLEELVFGLDPTIRSYRGGADPNAENAPRLMVEPNRILLCYKIILDDLGDFSPIQVTPQQSADLVNWTSAPRLIQGIGEFCARRNVVPSEKGFLRVVIHDPLAP